MNSVGQLLKYHRLNLGLTQDYVCKGICTVSHLSKVENGKTGAPSALIRDLFKRLDIVYHDDASFVNKYNRILQNAFQAYIYKRSLDEFNTELSAAEDKLLFSPLFIDYLIVKYLYKHFNRQKIESDKEMQLLIQIEDAMSQTQRGWLYYVLAVSNIPFNQFFDKLLVPVSGVDDCFVWAQALLGNSAVLLSQMVFHYANGNYDTALGLANELTHYALKEGNASSLALANLMVGNCYAARGMTDEVRPHYQCARQLFCDLKQYDKLAMIDYNLGATYLENHQYEKARHHLEKGLVGIKNNEEQPFNSFGFYEKLALLHGDLKQTHLAQQYLDKAKQILTLLTYFSEDERTVYEQRVALAEMRLIENYLDLPKYQKVLEELCQNLRTNREISWGYFNFYKLYLYDLYCHKRQYKKALLLMNEVKRV